MMKHIQVNGFIHEVLIIDESILYLPNRDSPTVWPLCAFFFILLQFYVPFYMKKKKIDNYTPRNEV